MELKLTNTPSRPRLFFIEAVFQATMRGLQLKPAARWKTFRSRAKYKPEASYWRSSRFGDDLDELLYMINDALRPEGRYFGTHPPDHLVWGFWDEPAVPA